MADLDKVLKGLECCKNGFVCGDDCPYRNVCFNGEEYAFTRLASDALELLKSQQAEIKRLQPKKGEWEPMEDYDDVVYRCSACEEEWTLIEGTPFDNGMKFCPHCGADMRDSYHFVSNL